MASYFIFSYLFGIKIRLTTCLVIYHLYTPGFSPQNTSGSFLDQFWSATWHTIIYCPSALFSFYINFLLWQTFYLVICYLGIMALFSDTFFRTWLTTRPTYYLLSYDPSFYISLIRDLTAIICEWCVSNFLGPFSIYTNGIYLWRIPAIGNLLFPILAY